MARLSADRDGLVDLGGGGRVADIPEGVLDRVFTRTPLVTENDERNAPVLAVNAALGYQHLARRIAWVRQG